MKHDIKRYEKKRPGFLREVRKTVEEDFQLDPKCDIVFKAIFTQGMKNVWVHTFFWRNIGYDISPQR
ncbi:MAG TPA: hypothetical protein VJ861_02590 [Treponemataceae bacterium]|nr:hypothetical protein [Treponemataceae bacterium]